jgi:hypothetical protein
VGWTTGVWFPTGPEVCVFQPASRPALKPTQPPIECVPGAFIPRLSWATHLYIVPRLRIRGAVIPFLIRLHDMTIKHRDLAFISFYSLIVITCYIICPLSWYYWRNGYLKMWHCGALELMTFTPSLIQFPVGISTMNLGVIVTVINATCCISGERTIFSKQPPLKRMARRQWAAVLRPWTKSQDTMEYYLAAT